MAGARKIEGGARELRGDSVAFDWCGNFRVIKHEAAGESAIRDERAKPVYSGLEAMCLFVVRDSNGVQI